VRIRALAGDVDGGSGFAGFGLLGWGVGFEPGGLFGDEFGGGFAEVADGLEGELAGDGVGGVIGRGLEGGGPAVGGFEDLGEGLAEVGVAGAVVVEVVGELVGDGGELLEQVVGVLLAAGAAGLGVEVVDLLGAEVEELDEEEDAVGGVVAGVADLLDLFLAEGGIAGLGGERWGEGEERKGRDGVQHERDAGAIPEIAVDGHEGYPRG